LYGLRKDEPRPRWLLVIVILRAVLLIASLAFLATVIVFTETFGIFYWAWVAAGIGSLLADPTAISLPLISYKQRRPVAIAHAVLDGVAIALFAISDISGVFRVLYRSVYGDDGNPMTETGSQLASAISLFIFFMT
jgi:hypothetical protein